MLRPRYHIALWCAVTIVTLSGNAVAIKPGEGSVQTTGGQIWYRVVGEGNGVPLLVIHGGPGMPSDYLFSLGGLASDRPVVFYDQLGCGRSATASDSQLWTIEYFVSELDVVRKALHLDEVHLYGHAWGSIIAVEYMLTQPEGVKSLVLCSPVLSYDHWEQDIDSLVEMLPDSIRTIIAMAEREQSYASANFQQAVNAFYGNYFAREQPWSDDLMNAVQTRNLSMSTHMVGPSPFSVTGTLSDYDCTPRLSQITVATLLLAGDHDEVLPSTLVSYNKMFPNSRAVIVGRSGHLPSHDQPGKHSRIVGEFLKEIEK
jgi:proline-specific peptidase